MAAKREQTLWESVWGLSQRLERKYSLKAICSAGVLLLSEMSAEDRENIIERASIFPHSPEDIVDGSVDETTGIHKKQSRNRSKNPKSTE